MAAELWPEASFAEVINFQEGPGILAKDFRERGVPLVRLSGLERGGSVLEGCRYLDADSVQQRWAHFALMHGDILLSSSASLGRIAVVGDDGVGAIPYTGIIRMRPRDDRVYGPFIRYVLEAPEFQRQAEVAGVGSVMRHFGPMHLRQMTVRLPPPKSQRAIARVLGALDDKIRSNGRMNETLEAIAQAFFKSWFLDFEPVHAKMEGHDLGLPKSLADLFPNSFEDSKLGEIPKGWTVGAVGDALSLSRKALDPGDYADECFDLFSIPAFDAGRVPACDFGETIKSQKVAVVEGCVLVSKLNPSTPRVWLPPVTSARRQIASTEFLVCVGDAARAMSRELIYCLASSAPVVEYLTTHASGTSNSHQRVRPQDFLDFPLVHPPVPLREAFSALVRPLFDRIATSRNQAATLATVRETLLPKLISGEVRVEDAKRIAEVA